MALGIANDLRTAASTFPAGVLGVHPAGDDPLVPRLVRGVAEDAALHPEGPFAIASAAIPALLRFEVAQMFKDEDARLVLSGKLDDASTHLMGQLLIAVPDRAPQGNVILFTLGDQASLVSVPCHPSKPLLPKAGYRSAPADEAGGKDRTFNGLDGAAGKMFPHVQINGTDLCVRVGRELLLHLWWTGKLLPDGRMQLPRFAMPHELRAARFCIGWQLSAGDAHLQPAPTRAGPDLEHHAALCAFFPLPGIERSGLVPRSGRHWWALGECLALCQCFLFAFAPFLQMCLERSSRAKCSMDSSSPKQGRDLLCHLGKRHNRMRVLLGGVGERFQGSHGLLVAEFKYPFMRLDDLEVESSHAIEKSLVGSKPGAVLWPVVQDLPDGGGCLCHLFLFHEGIAFI